MVDAYVDWGTRGFGGGEETGAEGVGVGEEFDGAVGWVGEGEGGEVVEQGWA